MMGMPSGLSANQAQLSSVSSESRTDHFAKSVLSCQFSLHRYAKVIFVELFPDRAG